VSKIIHSADAPAAPSAPDTPKTEPKPDALALAIEALKQRIAASPPPPKGGTKTFIPAFEELRPIIGHGGLPDGFEFDGLQRVLAHLLKVPWTAADVKYFKELARVFREEQKRRDAVVADLRRKLAELKRLDPQGYFYDRKQRLDAAIAALHAVNEDERIWPADAFGATREFDPWRLVVNDIGRALLKVLRSADMNAVLPPRADFNTAAVDYVYRKLKERINVDDLPEQDKVVDALRKLAEREFIKPAQTPNGN
jgi:hypothetical protein